MKRQGDNVFRLRYRLLALLLGFCLLFDVATGVYACGPDLPIAVMVNGIHPDLPLKLFASGNLGVIQSGYARSYLIVCYRYLSGNPLDQAEQASIDKLWRERLYGMQFPTNWGDAQSEVDPRMEYFKLRARILGQKIDNQTSIYDCHFAENICIDGFAHALKNLRALVRRFGQTSAKVKDWLAAQDNVFGVSSGSPCAPAAEAPDADPVIRAQRAYQQAAAKFYSGDLTGAQELFEAIADDKASEWKDLAAYMAARANVKDALDSGDSQSLDDAMEYTRDIIARNPSGPYKTDLLDLCAALEYKKRSPSESLKALVRAVLQRHNGRFGNDVGDLTYLLNENLYDTGSQRLPDDPKGEADRVSG